MTKPTISEAELRRLFAEGKTMAQIAAGLGRSAESVRAACCVLGVTSERKTRATKLLPIVERLAEGYSLADVAAEHGLTREGLFQKLKRNRFPTACLGAVRYLRASKPPADATQANPSPTA